MNLHTRIHSVFDEVNRRRKNRHFEISQITGNDVWEIEIDFSVDRETGFRARGLCDGDSRVLLAFRDQLSDRSRKLFSPYPWDESDALNAALDHAVEKMVKRVDAAYIIEREGVPVAHYFLWKAGGNAYSAKYGLQIPELGIAVADKYHGRGLGGLIVRILLLFAELLGSDAVELTTCKDNESGWQTYLRSGFEHVGFIWNPLEVNVTAALAGEVKATLFEEERQMVAIINESKRPAIERYVAITRDKFAELYKQSQR